MRWLALVVCLATAARLGASDIEALRPDARPGIADLFRPSFIRHVRLSPDGQRLAAIHANEVDIGHLLIRDLAGGQTSAVGGTAVFDVSACWWIDSRRLLFRVAENKIYAAGLSVVDVAALQENFPVLDDRVSRIIAFPRSRPDRALVWLDQFSRKSRELSGLVELDLTRDISKKRHREPATAVVVQYPSPPGERVLAWLPDERGELAFAISEDRELKAQVYRYLRSMRQWDPVPVDLDSYDLVTADPDGRHLWVSSNNAFGVFFLQRVDSRSGELQPPIHTDPRYDPGEGRMFFSAARKTVAGLTYDQARAKSVWFDPAYARAQAAVDHALPDADNVLLETDEAERRFLFSSLHSARPTVYLLYDGETQAIRGVGLKEPWFRNREFPAASLVQFRTRDQFLLDGYLTLPPEASPENPVPLVLLVHGGPAARDTWQFEPEVQFLVSRGYAVLQPNYRGSTGYWEPPVEGENLRYLRMHEDVTDAARHAQAWPMIDRDRLAIMGWSFGGYLAMAGLAFEPDLYRCGISGCGVFDWRSFIRGRRLSGRPGEYEALQKGIGHEKADRARLDAMSPLVHVDSIRAPVLIAHGAEDWIVDAEQSRRFVAALKKRKRPHETFFRTLEGHGFYNHDNRVAFYRQVESFLERHLAPRASGAAAAAAAPASSPARPE